MRKTDTKTLAKAMDILARDIKSDDGIANATIAEAAERLRELEKNLKTTTGALKVIHTWANFEWQDLPKGHALVPDDVSKLCIKAIRAAAMPNEKS
jgi:hypothetical protein